MTEAWNEYSTANQSLRKKQNARVRKQAEQQALC